MKKQKEEKQYTFEEFDLHISLYNLIPPGNGNSLSLLRKICDGIQNKCFERNPSILIAGESAKTLAMAFANTLCSEDIRFSQAKYLNTMRNLIDCFQDSLFDAVHIISNPEDIGVSESVLWSFLNRREHKFTSYDGKHFEYIHSHGLIILTTDNIASVPSLITKSVDYKIITDRYSQTQLELIVHQKLRFCSVDCQAEDVDEVLRAIVSQGAGRIDQVMEFLKMSILIATTELIPLDMGVVNKAKRLTSIPAPPLPKDIPF